jgi:hypothetical protein
MDEEEYLDKDMKERNVYSKKTREDLVEDDQISAEEEAFMAGYDELDDETEEESNEDDKWPDE